jgi:hypothetical protein
MFEMMLCVIALWSMMAPHVLAGRDRPAWSGLCKPAKVSSNAIGLSHSGPLLPVIPSKALPVIPAKAGIQTAFSCSLPSPDAAWIPAFAGMTKKGRCAARLLC